MIQRVAAAAVFLALAGGPAQAQPNFLKKFNQYKEVAPGIDFFAADRGHVIPFEKPVNEVRRKLAVFLGNDLAKGAVFICSTLEQKDSVYEAGVLKTGYRWVITGLTPEASAEEMMARIKAQMGGEIPERVRQRFENRSPEMAAAMQARMVESTMSQIGFALLTSTLGSPDRPYRSSRASDVGRSTLADWLDMGLISYAAGTGQNIRFLQQHLEEAFPIEDVISMSRPYVLPPELGGPGEGGGMVIRMPRSDAPGEARPAGAQTAGRPGQEAPAGQSGGGRGRGGAANLPKEVQDRMTFDAQAAAMFDYLIEKVGVDKVKELVQWNREGKNVREMLVRPDMLGPDLYEAERVWQEWIKAQKPETGRSEMRMRAPAEPPL